MGSLRPKAMQLTVTVIFQLMNLKSTSGKLLVSSPILLEIIAVIWTIIVHPHSDSTSAWASYPILLTWLLIIFLHFVISSVFSRTKLFVTLTYGIVNIIFSSHLFYMPGSDI